MTNEEIKNKLQRGLALTVKESWDLYKYIEALEQQTCDDCVSREAIRNVLIRDNEMNGYSDRTHNLMEKLFDLPSVTPKTEAEKEMDCEHCIHTYGTLGCCDMVDNKWVYDCDFGHEQYVKQDIYKAIDELKTISRTGTVEKAVTENNINWLKWKIDKLLSDALKEAYIRGYDYGVKDWFSDAKDKINVKEWLDSFNTESATDCFAAVQRLKENMNEN